MSSDLIVDFPAQARRKVIGSKPKKMVRFSTMSDIQFYERPDKVHAKELHYSREDIREFETANRQAILDIHMKHLSLVNGTTEYDANVLFQGCEFTGIENLLTPSLMKKTMAIKRRCWDAVLDEQERQDASGYCDPDIARAAENYSRWATERALKIAIMSHTSLRASP